jgi:hypothetical protein
VNTIQLPAITDIDRANAVRHAVQRELGQVLTAAQWDEIKDKSLADLLAANTDALVDDVYEGGPDQDITDLLTAIKAGSELLDTDYLSQCLTHLKGRWAR